MTLEEDLGGQLQDAMRAGDAVRRDTIRQLRAALHNETIARGRPTDDEAAMIVVRRLVNQHKDSIAEFAKAGREDLVSKEQVELDILVTYLPAEIARDEIVAAARAAISATQAQGRKNAGKVMKELSGQLRGRADMRVVNEVVQELLGD